MTYISPCLPRSKSSWARWRACAWILEDEDREEEEEDEEQKEEVEEPIEASGIQVPDDCKQ